MMLRLNLNSVNMFQAQSSVKLHYVNIPPRKHQLHLNKELSLQGDVLLPAAGGLTPEYRSEPSGHHWGRAEQWEASVQTQRGKV